MPSLRTISRILVSAEQSEGVGARVRRSIGRHELRNFDPFLLLDHFKVGAPAGFPDHPHRGFETVTYILPDSAGSFQHEDFCGHNGIIGPGDLQWMTAGRGIIHAEMPVSAAPATGLQLWVNLPRRDKMCPPRYQELLKQNIPTVTVDGVTAVVISGEALGVTSQVFTLNETHYSHFTMIPGSRLTHPVPGNFNCFIYTLKGRGTVCGEEISDSTCVTFNLDGDCIEILAISRFEFVILAGKPIGEPIVQHGPFVMTSHSEIQNTFNDYANNTNGFEGASDWQSSIGN